MTNQNIKKSAQAHNCSIRQAQKELDVKPTNKIVELHKVRNAVKKVKLSEIKMPTNVSEFRENLRNYFAGYSRNELYVKTRNHEQAFGIQYDLISSFQDIIDITGDSNPCIIPLIDFDMNDVEHHMRRTNQTFSSIGFFHDNYEVYQNAPAILSKMKKSAWCALDNQILREFYTKVLNQH